MSPLGAMATLETAPDCQVAVGGWAAKETAWNSSLGEASTRARKAESSDVGLV
jgi:hypothetical protein